MLGEASRQRGLTSGSKKLMNLQEGWPTSGALWLTPWGQGARRDLRRGRCSVGGGGAGAAQRVARAGGCRIMRAGLTHDGWLGWVLELHNRACIWHWTAACDAYICWHMLLVTMLGPATSL